MKIDDRILNYEISKHLPKSTLSGTEGVESKQIYEKKKIEEQEGKEQDIIVNLSPASKEAQMIKEIISSEPDIREEKVSALKEKIASGNYKVDHEAVGDKIVDAFMDEIF